MIVTFIKVERLTSITLPSKVNGRFWIYDKDQFGIDKRLISIEAVSGEWVLKSSKAVTILNADSIEQKFAALKALSFYKIYIKAEGIEAFLFTEPISDDRQTFTKYIVRNNTNIQIGRSEENDICFKNKFISGKHAVLSYTNQKWIISDLGSTNGTFVNNFRIKKRELDPGDVIFIMGLKLILGNNIVSINNPDSRVILNKSILYDFPMQPLEAVNGEEEEEESMDTWDFFYRSPRFKRDIQSVEIKIDAPPTPQNPEQIPMALMLGPSMTMGMVSLATAGVTINNIANHGASLGSSLTSLLMSLSMMLSCVLWPVLTKKHEQKNKIKNERKRQEKYTQYLQTVRDDIARECLIQEEILRENNVPLEDCILRIKERRRNLWERSIGQNDFLSLRLGIGDLPLQADIKYPEKRFSMYDDNLQYALYGLVEKPKMLHQVPVTLNLTEDFVSGFIGKRSEVLSYVQNLILRLVALHSYDEVKLIFFIDKEEMPNWEFTKWLPHTWTDDKDLRFLATDSSQVKELSAYFEKIVEEREHENGTDTEFIPYYVVVAASKSLSDRSEFVSWLVKQKRNLGFSVLTLFDELKNLPKECSMVVEVEGENSTIYDKNDISGEKLLFKADTCEQKQTLSLAKILANTRLDLTSQRYSMPNMLTFLEMYGVGKIEYLNPLVRWQENDPTKTLQAPVGVDGTGEIFNLDLHEKFQGPHGLVAGMTGSGKSEFIITYILSMAINYHPNEVAFILIDYKGGGLTGAFEDEEKKIKLPHLAGTITNLDGASVKRSLISIQSELRRRQSIFNEARKVANEGTMDIYKYQKLHREAVVSEAVPHLFIISDEFAELKQQQPEFMEQLISAARIGRSLGVHLILATQKPNGVVDDQIWSNSRFRICLKVQEKADSMDMIKRPDAASLSTTGRFYLQVGFNEFFDMGQSAWCGAQYTPSDRVEKKKDNSIRVIDSLGRTIKEVKPAEKNRGNTSNVKQIVGIVKYLSDLAEEEHIAVRPLWLDAIPAVIIRDVIAEKYHYHTKKYWLNPVIGEYDDPFNQSQRLLTLPLSAEGNAIIYGSAGSGKGTFITTLIYSMITTHSPEELNLYLLDFGSETLRNFTKAPHVGDVLFSSDTEKINNLFKMIKKEVDYRKKLFADFGGDYQSYCSGSGKSVPNIVIIINNYSAFSELFEHIEDDVSVLTREGVRVGIMFLLTASAANAVRYRLQQNFKQMIVLQLNDVTDYAGILGSTDGVYPSKMKGRGIVKYERTYEFQTAHVANPGEESDFIKENCKKLHEKYQRGARKIPILPDKVDVNFLSSEITNLASVPVGVAKGSLQVCTMNFQSKYISLVLAADSVNVADFAVGLSQVLTRIPDLEVNVLDASGLIGAVKEEDGIHYGNNLGELVIDIFGDIVARNNVYKEASLNIHALESYTRRVFIVLGIKTLFEHLSPDEKDKMKVLLDKGEAIYKVHFILCESVSDLLTVSYEPWFKNHVQGNDGIWIGDGITDQYSLKVGKTTSNLYEEIGNKFGYLLTKGKPVLIKTLTNHHGELEGDEE